MAFVFVMKTTITTMCYKYVDHKVGDKNPKCLFMLWMEREEEEEFIWGRWGSS